MEYTHLPGSTAQVILLFHGTGGSSAELLGLGQLLNKDATLIGIDGEVFENLHRCRDKVPEIERRGVWTIDQSRFTLQRDR